MKSPLDLSKADYGQISDLRGFSEANPILLLKTDPAFGSWDHPDKVSRTRQVGDFRVTYFVLVAPTYSCRQISIATPFKSHSVPVVAIGEEGINHLLGLFGFVGRIDKKSGLTGRCNLWIEQRLVPTVNVSELIGETDEEFVYRVLDRPFQIEVSLDHVIH